MSKGTGILGGLLKSVATAGEVAIQSGVKGKRPNLAGCTPCASNARAYDIHQKNLAMMGQSTKPKRK